MCILGTFQLSTWSTKTVFNIRIILISDIKITNILFLESNKTIDHYCSIDDTG